MFKDILKYIKSCVVCGAQKMLNNKSMSFMGDKKKAEWPFQIISLDLIGPLPPSKKRNKYILVVSDFFSKYTFLFLLKDAKSSHIECIIENEIFLVYGTQGYLIYDNGSQFAGRFFKKICNKYDVHI